MYTTITKRLPQVFHFNRATASITRHPTHIVAVDAKGVQKEFDYVIFACSAEIALRLLSTPSRMERFTLSNVKYFDDVTYTHTDGDYMRKMYAVSSERSDQYFVRTVPDHPEKVQFCPCRVPEGLCVCCCH